MKKNDKTAQCPAWLKTYLSGKIAPCDEVREAAFAEGYTRRELQQARMELGVVSGSITTWGLPKEDET